MVWVREFGNVFGNTVYSASLIVAVFMLGLGAGSYVAGRWADQRFARRPASVLAFYGIFEVLIGVAGFAVSIWLPHLGALSAAVSSYSRDANGWYALSLSSYAARAGIAAVVLTPITSLMGGTLTLLIRYCVRRTTAIGPWRIALLYGVNTAGAATGAFLTDFALVPAFGLQASQWIAAGGNLCVGVAALVLARVGADAGAAILASEPIAPLVSNAAPIHASRSPLTWISIALALSGVAAMGMEIVWFRHFTVLLGGFRAVFSLLLTVILVGIGLGSLLGGWLNRVTARPMALLMLGEALFVAFTALGLAGADVRAIRSSEAYVAGLAASDSGAQWWTRSLAELWPLARPMLVELGIPALILGLTFPLANAVVQRTEQVVGRRAGVLYLSNTLGNVGGSLMAGFLLLPLLGMQRSAGVMMIVAAATILPLYLASRDGTPAILPGMRGFALTATAALISGIALAAWLRLPADVLLVRAQAPLADGQRRLALVEGINEIVSVVDTGMGRLLLTNDYSMSGTATSAQRYMRALAHIPLLSITQPTAALVIGFGVGNTTHAITLHPTIRRVDVADLSKLILSHASYFAGANHNALADPRVSVYVEDGRQHLRMQPEGTYDLIALEPPPIAQAGVGALYSREFYTLARTRLTANGYISQWLPAYQVPAETTLAMIRAFVDVFPQAVLLCGNQQELLLVGTNASRIEIDPDRLSASLAAAPAVREDLRRVGFATPTDIVGTFVGAPRTLDEATRGREPVTDDRPIQEYGAKSRLTRSYQLLPASIFDVGAISAWCPKCFHGGRPVRQVQGLDDHLARAARVYDTMLRQSER